jgi:hypothetical protein
VQNNTHQLLSEAGLGEKMVEANGQVNLLTTFTGKQWSRKLVNLGVNSNAS